MCLTSFPNHPSFLFSGMCSVFHWIQTKDQKLEKTWERDSWLAVGHANYNNANVKQTSVKDIMLTTISSQIGTIENSEGGTKERGSCLATRYANYNNANVKRTSVKDKMLTTISSQIGTIENSEGGGGDQGTRPMTSRGTCYTVTTTMLMWNKHQWRIWLLPQFPLKFPSCSSLWKQSHVVDIFYDYHLLCINLLTLLKTGTVI